MNGTGEVLLAGLVAGYGLAMPMGAISVLLIHEALTRGWRIASAAASGTALVDLGYACLALGAGAAVTDRLQGWTRTVQLIGAAVLVAVVAHGLRGLRRPSLPPRPAPAGGSGTNGARPGQGHGDDACGPRGGQVPARGTATVTGGPGRWRTLQRFVALTAINPLTAVYFVVLTCGLGRTVHGTAAAATFAAGVFVASLSWQLLLVGVGSLAGARLPEWARTAASLTGYAVVLGYAVKLALG